MTFTNDQLERLLDGGETEAVEFKERIREPRTLARLIGAMANSGGGTLLVGVREPRSVVGVVRSELQRIYDAALQRVRPPPPTLLSFSSLDGKEIGVVEIGTRGDLVLSDEGAFVREGAASQPMEASGIALALAKRPEVPAEEGKALAEGIVSLTKTITELNTKIDRASSFRGQLPNYLIGGIIGAIISWLVTLL